MTAHTPLTAEQIDEHYPKMQHQPDECEMCHAICQQAKSHVGAGGAVADLIRDIDRVTEDFDFNPEGTGELSGRDAVLEFTHSDDFEDIMKGHPSPAQEAVPEEPESPGRYSGEALDSEIWEHVWIHERDFAKWVAYAKALRALMEGKK